MIQLSPSAITEILRLRAKRPGSELLFRLNIVPQGCLGLAYAMEFDTNQHPGDRQFDCGGLSVFIQAAHLGYIENLVIDYSEDMMGGGFRFNNAKALRGCGCGNSFAISA